MSVPPTATPLSTWEGEDHPKVHVSMQQGLGWLTGRGRGV